MTVDPRKTQAYDLFGDHVRTTPNPQVWNPEVEQKRAISAAQDKGAQVLRDDWVFPNWDPTRDYTTQDYAAL